LAGTDKEIENITGIIQKKCVLRHFFLPSIRKGKREEDRDGLGRRGRLDERKQM